MADFIKPKRLSFAEEMGVASKLTGKKLDVTFIEPNVEKLMEIKSEQSMRLRSSRRRMKRQNPMSSELMMTMI